MKKNIVIVGGGISGLTAAAFLTEDKNNNVILIEQSEKLGGLVGSFEEKGFVFDSGIRAIENAGVIFPMLRSLGISVPFKKNKVTLGIEDKFIELVSFESLIKYQELLVDLFPEEESAIKKIIQLVQNISKYMDVLYGIDNPLFLDFKKDKEYLTKVVVPWMLKYAVTINKIQKLNKPVNDCLLDFTKNQELIDMITQHFFTDTPTFFALSYFRLYTDYYYPEGGTATLVNKIEDFIVRNNGIIKTNSEVSAIDVNGKTIKCKDNSEYKYDKLLWAADLKTLYRNINVSDYTCVNRKKYLEQKKAILKAKGNDSIFTLYIESELELDYYMDKCSEHCFYAPKKTGLGSMGLSKLDLIENKSNKEAVFKWIKEYSEKTTYEISIPVLRDDKLAPEGKSGLIVSTVFDYGLTEYIKENNMYEEFKEFLSQRIISVLTNSIFPNLDENILEYFSSTPITIETRLNNSDGAITGWSFSDKQPVESSLKKIAKSVETPFDNIYQSGHWVFTPSGLPTAIITAKVAADKINKK
ncbi:MAG: NAD(P)/FAD-dependent oxidoreductase [Clostridiales bacterium]|nr:NAD(P)/FAD-dependent oxidoreductase [Clostridiales bacterium]